MSQSIDIWSLGCVYSEVATWMASGYRGILEYRAERRSEIDRITDFLSGDGFHNGETLLDVVPKHHQDLLTSLSHDDFVTKAVLTRMVEDMLEVPDGRPTANQLWIKSQRILRRAEDHRVNSTDEFSEKSRSTTTQSSYSQRPTLPPTLPPSPSITPRSTFTASPHKPTNPRRPSGISAHDPNYTTTNATQQSKLESFIVTRARADLPKVPDSDPSDRAGYKFFVAPSQQYFEEPQSIAPHIVAEKSLSSNHGTKPTVSSQEPATVSPQNASRASAKTDRPRNPPSQPIIVAPDLQDTVRRSSVPVEENDADNRRLASIFMDNTLQSSDLVPNPRRKQVFTHHFGGTQEKPAAPELFQERILPISTVGEALASKLEKKRPQRGSHGFLLDRLSKRDHVRLILIIHSYLFTILIDHRSF
jgi:hypothetical protein